MSEDKRLERIEVKVDAVLERQASQGSILAAQHESLKSHMRRTELLEAIVIPMNKERYMIKGALKLVGCALLLCGGIESILALLNYVHK